MHELGVVFSIIKTVEEVAAENDVTEVSSVKLHLGEVSTVIPEYLTDCWNWAVKRTEVLHDARLNITQIDAVTVCNSCGKTYPTVAHGRICPHCQSPDTVLLRGNEIEIDTVEGV